MKKNVIFLSLFFIINISALVNLKQQEDGLSLTMVYGTVKIEEPVLVDLIQSSAFERLKQIRQYGVMCHARPEPEYTRYDHSLGVFFLVKKYGALLEEQIDALLHDTSHTVFSHVGDRVFKSNYFVGGKVSYQDTIHEWHLEKSGIIDILKKYGFACACSEKMKKGHHCFDQNLPDLCADRIEYNVTGGLIAGFVTADEVNTVLEHLHFEDKIWFFDNVESARTFGMLTLALTESHWGSPWSGFIDHTAAQALARAHQLGIVSLDEIHFSVDDLVWQKLATTNDAEIARCIYQIEHCNECWQLGSAQDYDLHIRTKFSGTNPLVQTGHGLERLTSLDAEYDREFERVKERIAPGWYLKVGDRCNNLQISS